MTTVTIEEAPGQSAGNYSASSAGREEITITDHGVSSPPQVKKRSRRRRSRPGQPPGLGKWNDYHCLWTTMTNTLKNFGGVHALRLLLDTHALYWRAIEGDPKAEHPARKRPFRTPAMRF